MDKVTLLAWKFRGAVNPAGDPVMAVRPLAKLLQGTTTAAADVEVLQSVAPDGPPSP
jgi:hypothetical protein